MNVSVVILTFNEECNIRRCLSSLSGFDDVHIIDSGSSDRTLEFANSFNVTIHHNQFSSFGEQRNFAHENCQLKHEWVMHLDADEEMTSELEREIKSTLQQNIKYDCFNISSKLIFFGKFLKYASEFPTFQVRLLRKHMRFRDVGHGQKEICDICKIGRLTNSYLHYNFSHGIQDWLSRHVNYARKEADLIWDHRKNFQDKLKKINKIDRATFKLIYSFIPLYIRPFLKFFYLAICKGGLLDGKFGLYFCVLQFSYEVMILVFYIEKRHSNY